MEDRNIIVIGSLQNKGWHNKANEVLQSDGIVTCIHCQSNNLLQKIIEIKKVVNMNETNRIFEQSRAEQSRAEQSRAEQVNCVRIGNVYGEQFGASYAGNVYDSNGISPVLMTMQGGGRQPHIVESRVIENMNIKVKQPTKEGYVECDVPGVLDLNYESSKTRRGRVQNRGWICPTLTTENFPSLVEFGSEEFSNFLYEFDGELYLIRIRKLTPRECWRLMNFSDLDFSKAEKVNSNTQLYKQAGNSIVKNCLVGIFGQMFEGKEDVYKEINNGKETL